MRLIDADRLKESFIMVCTGGGILGEISKKIIEWAVSMVDHMPTENRWIPCSERLPEHDNHVLCCTATAKGKKNIIIGYYLHGSERWASGMNSNVIAWMELPDPYREAVDD